MGLNTEEFDYLDEGKKEEPHITKAPVSPPNIPPVRTSPPVAAVVEEIESKPDLPPPPVNPMVAIVEK